MIDFLEERRRFAELYADEPESRYEGPHKEEMEAIEKKLGGGGNVEVWFRDPCDGLVYFSAISHLPIRYEDEFVVVFHSELEALKKSAGDVVIDQLRSLTRRE
jgi:hypothetical protein